MKDPDLVIVGGGVGGCAAALAACHFELRTVMTEQYDWIGGQLTSQCVPPDENPWIEELGCSLSYSEFRQRVRDHYVAHEKLTEEAESEEFLNPGGGWVSRLCHTPEIAHRVLYDLLDLYVISGQLQICTGLRPVAAKTDGDRVVSVDFIGASGKVETLRASFFIDATETGELLPITRTEYVVGAESKSDTDEPHAIDGDVEPDNVQGITWCAVIGYDKGGSHVIEKPEQYEFWRNYQPKGWPDKLLSFKAVHAQRGAAIDFPLFGNGGFNLFSYRQIVDGKKHKDRREDATVMNWPMNDYCVGSILDVPAKLVRERLEAARQLTLSMLYWLQTAAPRHDGGTGYPELRLRPDLTGTEDGLAMAPYIRESRRIKAMFTVKEQHIAAECNPRRDRAPAFEDSVGIGAYRIDLHPTTNGRPTIDLSSLPFQIPLGCLIPVRTKNLIPACKNIGTTHITNGCYRLHPVEWNVGEAAAVIVKVCRESGVSPQELGSSKPLIHEVQTQLAHLGVLTSWGDLPVHAL
ncbi:MAG: FAD-dependent oxidoreductase [Armatimonadetes bacterium]|nr:FAD-dependent oxidoreductase [Armatimonadota bacterium]